MMRTALLALALAACALAAELPIRRLPHTGVRRGLGRSRGRIIGSVDATRGQFPYQVSLQWMLISITGHTCGGCLISTKAVLTAGQCTRTPSEWARYWAVAGEHDLSLDDGTEQKVLVAEQIRHPDYKEYANNFAINDLAVFTLQSEFTLGTFVQTIALPEPDSVPTAGSSADLTGWGATNGGDFPHYPNVLQYYPVTILAMSECYELLANVSSPFNDNSVCTGPVQLVANAACIGDFGGPLGKDSTLIGIASWSLSPCGIEDVPTVYTRVSAYEDFIKQYL